MELLGAVGCLVKRRPDVRVRAAGVQRAGTVRGEYVCPNVLRRRAAVALARPAPLGAGGLRMGRLEGARGDRGEGARRGCVPVALSAVTFAGEPEQPQVSLGRFVQGAVQENLELVAGLRKMVKGTDTEVEVIHKMRVRWRRLRTIVREAKEFASVPQSVKAKEITTFLNFLGSSRDLDVQVELLHELERGYMAGDVPDKVLARLHKRVARIARQREEAMGDHAVGKKIVRQGKRLEKVLRAWIASGEPFSAAADVRDMSGSDALRVAPELQCLKLDALMSMRGWSVTEPVELGRPEMEDMHDLRKAFKTLRYQMELFHPIYRDGIAEEAHAEAIALVVDGSEILGKLQDAEMLMEAQAPWLRKNPDINAALERYVAHHWARWLSFSPRFQTADHLEHLEHTMGLTLALPS